MKNSIVDIDGLVDVNVNQQTEIPQTQIWPNRDMLAAYRITIEEFNVFVSLAFSGEKLADIYAGQRSFDLVLWFNKDYTETIEGIRSALIEVGNGNKVPLGQVAEIGFGSRSQLNKSRKCAA